MKIFLKKLLVTGLYTGYLPGAPGTFGTLIGVGIYLLLFKYPYILCLLIVLLFICGVRLSTWAEEYFKEKDSQKIVIDEIVGYLITMAGVGFIYPVDGPKLYMVSLIGFILFRLFDIFKPFYIKKAEQIKGGLGVMLDDALAGVYSNLVLILIMAIWG